MAYSFTTRTGSAWSVKNGRISRYSTHTSDVPAFEGERILSVINPVIPGKQATFNLAGFGPVDTGVVVMILPGICLEDTSPAIREALTARSTPVPEARPRLRLPA